MGNWEFRPLIVEILPLKVKMIYRNVFLKISKIISPIVKLKFKHQIIGRTTNYLKPLFLMNFNYFDLFITLT